MEYLRYFNWQIAFTTRRALGVERKKRFQHTPEQCIHDRPENNLNLHPMPSSCDTYRNHLSPFVSVQNWACWLLTEQLLILFLVLNTLLVGVARRQGGAPAAARVPRGLYHTGSPGVLGPRRPGQGLAGGTAGAAARAPTATLRPRTGFLPSPRVKACQERRLLGGDRGREVTAG